jgi:hypothetical protein
MRHTDQSSKKKKVAGWRQQTMDNAFSELFAVLDVRDCMRIYRETMALRM